MEANLSVYVLDLSEKDMIAQSVIGKIGQLDETKAKRLIATDMIRLYALENLTHRDMF